MTREQNHSKRRRNEIYCKLNQVKMKGDAIKNELFNETQMNNACIQN